MSISDSPAFQITLVQVSQQYREMLVSQRAAAGRSLKAVWVASGKLTELLKIAIYS